jgi:3-oxoacyl-[acyl-carrier-protein] synthase II
MGLLSPLGTGIAQSWEAAREGLSGIGPITRFDAAHYSSRIAGECKDFDPLAFMDRKEARKMDRFIQYAVAAAQLAVGDSGIDSALLKGDRAGVYVGSGIGGIGSIENTHKVLLEKGPGRVSPFFLISSIINEAAGQVSILYNSGGPNSATATACSSGTHAIGDSFRIIVRGDADIMLAGGAEAPITPLGVAGFCAMRALSTRNDAPAQASRPFDKERDGFVVGEGSVILLLEERASALKRGARIYAEIVGYGTTPWNDKIETLAIKRLFGDHAYKLAVSSTKSMTGHLLGAAGGLEAGLTALSLYNQVLPPTINYENPDPECDLDYVPNQARPSEVTFALSNSFGFGGTNGTLLLKRHS